MRAKAVKGLVPEDRNRFGWLNRELARQTFATEPGEPDPSLARATGNSGDTPHC